MLQISSGPNGVAVEEAHGGSRIVEDFREQVSTVLSAKLMILTFSQVKKLKKGLPFSMELSAIVRALINVPECLN